MFPKNGVNFFFREILITRVVRTVEIHDTEHFVGRQDSVLKNCVVYIHTLMVKPVRTLALQAMKINQSVLAQLTRIQYGFCTEKSIQDAQQTVLELQTMLRDMEQSVHKEPRPPSRNFIPLK